MSRRHSSRRVKERPPEQASFLGRFIIDENVQKSIADGFRRRGHEVLFVGDELPKRMTDRRLADLADELAAMVVTYNSGHFKALISRQPAKGDPQPRRNASVLFLECKIPRGPQRIEACLDIIEYELARSRLHADDRVIIEIRNDKVIIHR